MKFRAPGSVFFAVVAGALVGAPVAQAQPFELPSVSDAAAGVPAVMSDGPDKQPDAFDRASAGRATARAAECRLAVWPVSQDYATNWLGVQGGRFDCANHATFTVELRKAIPFWPDSHLATAYGSGNGAVRAFAACNGRADYFGKVISSTGNVMEGPRTGLC